MRNIGVVTVGRSDYGIYLPLLRRIQQDPDLRLYLIVSGMHLSPEFGLTVKAIEEDGFEINERVEMLLSSDTPEGIAKSMGLGMIGFAQAYSHFRLDILIALGDRFEMHAAVMAALPFKIPIAHVGGGAVTLGAIDDALRHSITKLSHLHFAETEVYAKRIIQMGEEPWRVFVVGALSLDNLHKMTLLSCEEFEAHYGISLAEPPLLVTFHPVTLKYELTERYVTELLAALEKVNLPIVFTYPNADTSGRIIIRMVENFVTNHPQTWIVTNLGTLGYFSLMKYARAMVGNSSSGIIEAASFKLPVVNIGKRQEGRIMPKNVITVDYNRNAIICGIQQAINDQFRTQLKDLVNPYGDGHASEHIIHIIKTVELNEHLLIKRFYNTNQDYTL